MHIGVSAGEDGKRKEEAKEEKRETHTAMELPCRVVN